MTVGVDGEMEAPCPDHSPSECLLAVGCFIRGIEGIGGAVGGPQGLGGGRDEW